RALLRQDPDVILVGEIRDAETAHMALEAAMTGHQVYSTLHTASSLGAIPRLLELGVKRDILAGNLIGIIAQRLVRRLCPDCAEPRPADEAERRLLQTLSNDAEPLTWHPVGCVRCEHQGYRGRLAIMELLALDDELDELIACGASAGALSAAARAAGFRSLAEDGLRRVLAGATSLAELARVVDLTRRSR
ncbi:MAG: Flp pilus assembly complex ATPase component TadA, partial [Zoogloea sp.]|nr:Flp pilus assembly complex ATPase component TadA [Zoogloea sp.]